MSDHLLVIYDIPESLKIPNPSGSFRRYGFRLNLSAWCFPQNAFPSDAVEALRVAGASVEVIRFHPEDQEKLISWCKREVKKYLKDLVEKAQAKCGDLRRTLESWDKPHPELSGDERTTVPEKHYRRWRSVIARARRELVSAEQCALSFGITGDLVDGTSALKNLISSELGAALAYREKQKEKVAAPPPEPAAQGPATGTVPVAVLENDSWLPQDNLPQGGVA